MFNSNQCEIIGFKGQKQSIVINENSRLAQSSIVSAFETTLVPPRSEAVLNGLVENMEGPVQECVFEPKVEIFEKTGPKLSRHLVQQGYGVVPLSVVNTSNIAVKIHKDMSLGFLEPMEERSISFLKKSETDRLTFE